MGVLEWVQNQDSNRLKLRYEEDFSDLRKTMRLELLSADSFIFMFSDSDAYENLVVGA